MAEPIDDLRTRLEELERRLGLHIGPQPGATTLNQPHIGVPYFNEEHLIDFDALPTGTGATEVAVGNHTHTASVWGYYL